MAKKIIYTVVKLAPQVSSWCDKDNNIYLSVPNKTSKRLKEGCDMKMINKGVKAGLIYLVEQEEEIQEAKPARSAKEIMEEVKAKKVKKAKPAEEVKVEVNIVEEEKKEEDNNDKEE